MLELLCNMIRITFPNQLIIISISTIKIYKRSWLVSWSGTLTEVFVQLIVYQIFGWVLYANSPHCRTMSSISLPLCYVDVIYSCTFGNDLVQVIETFQLKISEGQLMSRCTKCNGRFIQKPLTTEEAVEAAKGFQVIPNCLFNKNIEFWQCMDCNQLYWEVTLFNFHAPLLRSVLFKYA